MDEGIATLHIRCSFVLDVPRSSAPAKSACVVFPEHGMHMNQAGAPLS